MRSDELAPSIRKLLDDPTLAYSRPDLRAKALESLDVLAGRAKTLENALREAQGPIWGALTILRLLRTQQETRGDGGYAVVTLLDVANLEVAYNNLRLAPLAEGSAAQEATNDAEIATGDESPGALARCLRKAREHQGHTLRAVEAATGVQNAHLSQVERGIIGKPSLDVLAPLAAFYRLDLRLLAEWAGYSPDVLALLGSAAREDERPGPDWKAIP